MSRSGTNSDGQQLGRDVSKSHDIGSGDIPKKRPIQDEGIGRDEAQGGKKRARGRPRLNPKDQTAAEVCVKPL